jgi:hypothetical protein
MSRLPSIVKNNNRPVAISGNRMAAYATDSQSLTGKKNGVQYFSQRVFTLAGVANYLYHCIVLAVG